MERLNCRQAVQQEQNAPHAADGAMLLRDRTSLPPALEEAVPQFAEVETLASEPAGEPDFGDPPLAIEACTSEEREEDAGAVSSPHGPRDHGQSSRKTESARHLQRRVDGRMADRGEAVGDVGTTKWDYCRLYFCSGWHVQVLTPDGGAEEILPGALPASLAMLGAQGWELVSVGGTPAPTYYYFKRPA